MVLIDCYCLKCQGWFKLTDFVGSYGVPIRCPLGHDGDDEVAVVTPFIKRLLPGEFAKAAEGAVRNAEPT